MFTTKSIAGELPATLFKPSFVAVFDYDRIVEDAREVLRTLDIKEVEVSADNGARYLMRILPYRTTENTIEGAVLTFNDISASMSLGKGQARLLEAPTSKPKVQS